MSRDKSQEERVVGNTLVFDLVHEVSINRWLPHAKIVQVLQTQDIGNLRAAAQDVNIESYGIDLAEDKLKGAYLLSQQLHPESLVQKYNTNKKRQQSLVQLMQDEKKKDLILANIDKQLDQFYNLVVLHGLHMVENAVRDTRLQQLRIEVVASSLSPSLHFNKTNEGIYYTLKLVDDAGKVILPKQHDIKILTNENPWILLNFKLYRLEEINGNKLRPFLKQESLFIKNSIAVDYFRKFVISVASKVDIEATGFEVIKYNDIIDVVLSTTYDIFASSMVANVAFHYEGKVFYLHDIIDRRSKLHISSDGHISIHQIIRNQSSEQSYVDQLLALGLTLNGSKRLVHDNSDDGYSLVPFLGTHVSDIMEIGVKVQDPMVDGRTLTLEAPSIKLYKTINMDWFDIMGVVEVGDQSIPFAHLLQHIKKEDRFYQLEDGTYFIIPQAWMSKYKELAKFGIQDDDKVKIRKSQFTLVDDLDEDTTSQAVLTHVHTDLDFEYIPSKQLQAALRPYQEEGVKWLINHQRNGLGACLADDMGLGKTLQTIAVLSYTKDHLKRNEKSSVQQLSLFGEYMVAEISPLRALIILPSSLVYNWYQEIKKFNPTLHVIKHIGAGRARKAEDILNFDIVLTTYQTAVRDVKLLSHIEWEYIVLDESQMIKNKNSKIFQSINSLSAINKLSLSGTPIENSLSDLWSQMQFINDGLLGSFSFFKNNYLKPIEQQKDEDAKAELAKLVQPYILRRTKEEVAKDLPPITEVVEYVELGRQQKEMYEKVKSGTRNFLLGLDESDTQYRFHVFAALNKLRLIANHPVLVDESYTGDEEKLDLVTSKMDELIKARHKVLIFSPFTKLLDLYIDQCQSRGWSYASLRGSDSQANREKEVNKFQADSGVSFFFISLKAGGVGLNLTAADYVFILDPWWNPFAEKQAIARAHRIGQDKPITVIRYIAQDTIEEKIIKLQAKKNNLSDDILNFEEGKNTLNATDIVDLIG